VEKIHDKLLNMRDTAQTTFVIFKLQVHC